jgi:hypothetical protein
MRDELNQCWTFASRWRLEQLNEVSSLFSGQRQWWDTNCSTFCNVLAVSFKHGSAFEKVG